MLIENCQAHTVNRHLQMFPESEFGFYISILPPANNSHASGPEAAMLSKYQKIQMPGG